MCILTGLLSGSLALIKIRMNDSTLKDIRAGNQHVLAEMYKLHRKEFIKWAFKSFKCSREDAEEVYQVSFFIFYDNVMTGKLEQLTCNLKTYLFAVGKNKILEQNRRLARHAFDIKEEIMKMDENGFDDMQDVEQQYTRISTGLQKLGDPCKSILEMIYYENCTMESVTQKFGYKNVDTAKNIKYKCMQRLKKIVEAIKV